MGDAWGTHGLGRWLGLYHWMMRVSFANGRQPCPICSESVMQVINCIHCCHMQCHEGKGIREKLAE